MKIKYIITLTLVFSFCTINISSGQKTAQRANDFMESIGLSGVRPSIFSDEQWPIAKQRMEELQVRYIRSWIYDESKYIDRQYELYQELGIKTDLIHPTLGTTPTEGITAIKTMYPTYDMIAGIEGLNEPFAMSSKGTIEDYRNHQKEIYNLVNSDPDLNHIPVIGISVAHPEEYEDLGDLSAYVDFGNMHPYPNVNLPPSGGRLQDWLNEVDHSYSGKPLWSTESGYHNNVSRGGTPDHIQAKYVPRLLLYHFLSPRIHKTFYFMLMDRRPLPDSRKWWGINLNDSVLTPKPAHNAWKNMSAILNDFDDSFQPGSLDYSISGKTSDMYEVLLQKGDGSYYLIIWNDARCWLDGEEIINDPVPVELTFNEEVKAVNSFIPSPEPIGYGQKVVNSYISPESLTLEVLDQITILEIHTAGQMEGISITNCPDDSILLPDTMQFNAQLFPENPILKKIHWESSNETVASVDSLGTLHSHSEGQTTIKAYTYDSSYVDSCVCKILKVDVDSIVSPDTIYYLGGEIQKINSQIYPENASVQDIQWKSLDTTIATVDENGYLTAYSNGIVPVVATSLDSGLTDTTIVVTTYIPAEGLNFLKDTIFLPYNKLLSTDNPRVKDFLPYAFIPGDASNQNIHMKSLDENVIPFTDSQNIGAVQEGMTHVIIYSHDSTYSDTAFIVINSQYFLSDISILGDSVLIDDKSQGKEAYDDDPNTSFSNSGVLEDGWIQLYLDGPVLIEELNIYFFLGNVRTYPIKVWINDRLVYEGSSEIADDYWSVPLEETYSGDTITIQATGNNTDNNAWFKINEVQVIGFPDFVFTERIEIQNCIDEVLRNDSILIAEVFPENSTDQRVEWNSSDPSVAIINKVGEITVVGTGSITITASSPGFSSISAECSFEASIEPPLPEVFDLTAPDDKEITDKDVVFSWEKSAYATSYTIVIDDQEDFSNPEVLIANLSSNSIMLDLSSLDDTKYYWDVISYNGAGSTESSGLKQFNLLLTGITPNKLPESIRIFPNPVDDGKLYIKTDNDLVIQNLTILSLTGKEIHNRTNTVGSAVIDISHLDTGIYILKIGTADFNHSQLLMVE